jgi:hypothetical protein
MVKRPKFSNVEWTSRLTKPSRTTPPSALSRAQLLRQREQAYEPVWSTLGDRTTDTCEWIISRRHRAEAKGCEDVK